MKQIFRLLQQMIFTVMKYCIIQFQFEHLECKRVSGNLDTVIPILSALLLYEGNGNTFFFAIFLLK